MNTTFPDERKGPSAPAVRIGAWARSAATGIRPSRVRCWWRRRESNPRPKGFRGDVYMISRVVPARRPEALRHLAAEPDQPGESRPGRQPLISPAERAGRRPVHLVVARPCPVNGNREDVTALSRQGQLVVGLCVFSTVYERWAPVMQSPLPIPPSNPVRPLQYIDDRMTYAKAHMRDTHGKVVL